MAVLGTQFLINLMVSVDVKQQSVNENIESEPRSCVEVNEDILGLPSLIDRTISLDVKQHRTNEIINCAMILEMSRIVCMVSVDVRQSIKPEHSSFFFSSSSLFFFFFLRALGGSP